MTVFTLARREQMRLRLALQGPAGSGKTFTAFTLAQALSPDGSFAVIDTERRALEYADRFTFGHIAPGKADPKELPGMVAAAANERYGALVVDSFTHYWSGEGGALDTVDRSSDKRRGWSEYRPVENSMMSALLTYPGHVIVTMRVKTEHVTEIDAKGRAQTRRVGLKPDQRDGVDYEFSVIGQMDTEHSLTITKTTCAALVDQVIHRPGLELADTLRDWLGEGEAAPDLLQLRDRALECRDKDDLREVYLEAQRRNWLGAVVMDGTGDLVTFDKLIRARKTELETLGAAVLAAVA